MDGDGGQGGEEGGGLGGAHCMASFLIAVVASMKRVSVGAILWKTTLEMEDLPLLSCGFSRDS